MRAAQITECLGPDAVRVVDTPEPVAESGQVLVDVVAAGLSYPDLLMSHGTYQFKPELPFITGVDIAGVLRGGAAEWGLAAGDRVVGAMSHGAAAEVVAIGPDRLFALPESIEFAEAAGMPLTFLTAHFALVTRAEVHPAEWVQVNGAAGGVGTAALQVAKALGCRVVAMVATPEEAEFVRIFEPDDVVVGPDSARVRAITGGTGVDVILDVVGTDEVVLEGLRSLAEKGRFLTLGYVGGEIPSVRLNRLLLGNIDVRGVAWGPYSRSHPGFAQQQWSDVMDWLARGLVRPSPAVVRPLDEAADALRDIEERRVRGKVVLAVSERL